ncbi:MAG TPA: aspartyl protease family protein [Methylomirabilota bacterium]|nr:aspartyl protease family protein [Methylomirabilota bacterium]
MRRVLTFVLGVIIGQWLVFGEAASPAEYHIRAQRAWKARDYLEAMQLWSQAAGLQPADPTFHYYRGTALARLGLTLSARDAFQMALLLDPPPQLARLILQEIVRLDRKTATTVQETTVPLEHGLGVWIARVVLNDTRTGRFLVDTGSSVTVLSPALAADLGIAGDGDGGPVELQTLGGRTAGPPAIVGSLRVGDLELRDAPVVLHDPGPGLDGILGNTFLSRYQVTVDADLRQLHLRPVAHD